MHERLHKGALRSLLFNRQHLIQPIYHRQPKKTDRTYKIKRKLDHPTHWKSTENEEEQSEK